MKKLLGAFLLTALLVAPLAGSARAGNTEKHDISELTCDEFIDIVKSAANDKEAQQVVSIIYYWLEGYVAAKTKDTKITFGQKYEDHVKREAEGYVFMCSSEKKTPLLDMVNEILKK